MYISVHKQRAPVRRFGGAGANANEGSMSFRRIAAVLPLPLLLLSSIGWAGESGTMTLPAVREEMEMIGAPVTAAASAVPDVPVPQGAPVEQRAPAAENAAAPVAQSTPAPASGNGVPWWREAVAALGLASDPRPGETAQPAAGLPQEITEYVIGAGDQLGISVWRDDHLSRTVVVLPDGKISFPLIGEVTADGKTVAQLRKELEAKLARFVTDSSLSVEVKQSNSMLVYVIGRVNTPGRQNLFAPTNVLQALAMAGGLNPFADKNGVKVLRQQGGRTVAYPFDYQEVSQGRHLEANIELQRGDVVIVP